MSDERVRTERDSMGPVELPADAYYGASTARALENFPISGVRIPRRMIHALGSLKWAAATVNRDLGRLDATVAGAIERAADEVADGVHDEQFVVDLFQTGSGTSSNMNANEVIANRAAELLGAARGARDVVHPNDHVNLGQSSNDVVPTAIHLAALLAIEHRLQPGLAALRAALERKADRFAGLIKTGRTHLQDAAPIRLGQVFRGYAGQVERGQARVAGAAAELSDVALGGTAVGTGLNTHPEFASRVCARVSARSGVTVRETGNHFQAQATIDAVVAASGALRTVAVSLLKIADDLRWLASGPRAGLGELTLPEVQPGSSIMPGKVNPVIAESLIQVATQAIAADQALVLAGIQGKFELNTMLPLAAHNLIRPIDWLGAAAGNFAERCVEGIEATGRGPELVERGLGIATGLVPLIGYDAAAAIAHRAAREGRTVREIARERSGLTEDQLSRALDPERMTGPSD